MPMDPPLNAHGTPLFMPMDPPFMPMDPRPSCPWTPPLHAHGPSPSISLGNFYFFQVNKYAFSGGGATIEEHRAHGANLEVRLSHSTAASDTYQLPASGRFRALVRTVHHYGVVSVLYYGVHDPARFCCRYPHGLLFRLVVRSGGRSREVPDLLPGGRRRAGAHQAGEALLSWSCLTSLHRGACSLFPILTSEKVARTIGQETPWVWRAGVRAGRMLTGDVKKRLVEVLTLMVERHQRAREAVTDEVGSIHASQYCTLLCITVV